MTGDRLEEESGAERRTFFRVLTRLPVKSRAVSEREAETLARELPERRAPDFSRIDPGLAGWLDRIERKLDRVLLHLGIGDPVAFGDGDVQEVMLSGAGMSLASESPVPPGKLTLVEFEIPGTPAHLVRCLARVIRHQPPKEPGGPVTAAVAFEVINEADREAIVRHAVEVQRTLLRTRGRAGAEV